MKRQLILAMTAVGVFLASNVSAKSVPAWIQAIVSDMDKPHEAKMSGVPDTFDWAEKPRAGYGNNPPANFRAFTAWGVINEAAQGSTAINSRVEICNMMAFFRSKSSGKWKLVQYSKDVDGGPFPEDFATTNDEVVTKKIRNEKNGCISVKMQQGYNFHFWPKLGRVALDPKDLGGVFTVFWARLIPDNPNFNDDRLSAKYLGYASGDYWLSMEAQHDGSFTNVGDIGIPRARYITNDSRMYAMTTLSKDELIKNPPLVFETLKAKKAEATKK
jgi:hypothetical protein